MDMPDKIIHNEVFATGLESSLQAIAFALGDSFIMESNHTNVADGIKQCANGLNRIADAMDEYIKITLNPKWKAYEE